MPTPPILEGLDYCQYDTTSLSCDENDMFVVPVGAKGKTIKETNMYTGGYLPSPEQIKINRLFAALFEDSSFVCLDHPAWHSLVNLWVNSKLYIRHPLWALAHPVCILKEAKNFLELGRRDQELIMEVLQKGVPKGYEIPIGPIDPFKVTIVCHKRLYPSIQCWIGLCGIKDRVAF